MTKNVDIDVSHRGISFILNPALLRRQGVDESGIEAIRAKHRELIDVRHSAIGVTDPSELRRIAGAIEACEFELQELWGFDRKASMHTHWLTIPGCTCPVRANKALWPHPGRVVARECPAHGGMTCEGVTIVETDIADAPRQLDSSYATLAA